MTIDLTDRTDEQIAYRMACLVGETVEWCRRVRHGS